jgi:CDP-2,3-bis-(O-geranylgeranyl)-sn-glycerol synthase
MADLTLGAILLDLLRIIVTLLPAMTANTFAPFIGGGIPVDLGMKRRDGRRYLGDGKTWSGFIGGTCLASTLGLLLMVIIHFLGIADINDGLWGSFPLSILIIISLACGSLVGDMIGSFIKRALDRPRGTKTPLLDQWDYLIGTTIFVIPFFNWGFDTFIADNSWIALILFLGVAWLAHTIANIIGYWIGVKNEPW